MAEARSELESPKASTEGGARQAGRGGIAILIAKVSFIVFGFAQQLALPAILGTAGYGVASRIFAVVGIVNNIVVAAALQGVSRTVAAASKEEAATAYRRVLTIHALVALPLATGFALLAPWIADWIEAPHIALPLSIVGIVVFAYGVYAPMVGGLNGLQKFRDQAGLDILYGALRMCITIAGAYIAVRVMHRDGTMGAVIGFSCAAMLIVPIAMTRAGLGKSGGSKPTTGAYLGFVGPLAFGLISLNLLLQTDFLLFSRFIGDAASSRGVPVATTDEFVGVYRAFQLFSFLPYQLLMSVTFVLFPMLAKAKMEGDTDAVRRFTETGMRLALVIVGLIVGVVAAIPFSLLRFAFPDPLIAEYGARAQSIHALGMATFALLGVMSAALTSLGKERVAALLTTVAVVLVALGSLVFVPRAEFGVAMLETSALTTAVALASVALVAAFALRRSSGGLVRPLTALRVAGAVGVVLVVGQFLPFLGRLGAPLYAVLIVVVYLVVLVVTGEIGRADLATLKAVLGRRKA